MGKKLGWCGGLFTATYLGTLAWYCWGQSATLKGLPPNEIGDFLAGAFGPLAILWLVLGFFQQGIELRQNSEALRLQAEELRNSVEQQAKLVYVAQEQLASDKAALEEQRARIERDELERKKKAQPRIILDFGGAHSAVSDYRIGLNNFGAFCTNISLSTLGINQKFQPEHHRKLANGERLSFTLSLPRHITTLDFWMAMHYLDSTGEEGNKFFCVTLRPKVGADFGAMSAHEISESEIPLIATL